MRNRHYALRPADVDANGIALAIDTTTLGFATLDGALSTSKHYNTTTGVTSVAFRSADKLARQLTFDQPSAGSADLSDARLEIIGLDCNNNPQTESGIVMPSSGVPVSSTKYFLAIYSIEVTTVDVTSGTVDVGTNGLVRAPWILMPKMPTSPYISFDETGTAAWSLDNTNEDVLNCFRPAGTPGAFEADGQIIRADESELLTVADDNFFNDSADEEGSLSDWPSTAIRLSTLSYGNGVILTLNIMYTEEMGYR